MPGARKRKGKANRVKEVKKRQMHFLDIANVMVQGIGADGKFVYVNKKWVGVLGYSNTEARKMRFTRILRKDQISHCTKIFKRIARGEAFEGINTVFMSKSGKEIYVEGDISPGFENGRFVSTIGIFRDVTDKHISSLLLQKSDQRLLSIISSIDDMIFTLDKDGRFEEYYQKTPSEKLYSQPEFFIGKRYADVLPKEVSSAITRTIARVDSTGKTQDVDYSLSLEGKVRWFNARISTRNDYNGEPVGYTAVVRDITRWKGAGGSEL